MLNSKEYIIRVYNTLTGKTEEIEVSEEIYCAYMRSQWQIVNNNRAFYKHEIQMSALIGGQDDAYENFKEFIDWDSDLSDKMEEHLAREWAAETLKKLPDSIRKRYILHFYYGIPCKEVANMEGVSVSAIKKSIGKAQRMLNKFREESDMK